MYTDRTISCVDCGQAFTFTAGEQDFYAQRGFTEAPKRCPSCRSARKMQRNTSSATSFGADRRTGSSGYGDARGGYAGGPSSPDRFGVDHPGVGYAAGERGSFGESGYSATMAGERRPRQMFSATCADCGKEAQLPFQPTGARPVYCSDCFQAHRG